MNNKNENAAGFAWRRPDRTTERGSWLRDLAIALGVALTAALLFMAGDAHAQDRIIQITGNTRTAMVDGHDRQVAGRAHRHAASSTSWSAIPRLPTSTR